ncbi:MAG: histidine phosphatase family protein [Actinomycetota bacterium]
MIFSRHAESEANAGGMINADPTIHNPLSVRGIEQATQLGTRLFGIPINICFTSELLRARQTAGIVLADREVPVIELADLNEPAAGAFEGKRVDTYNDWVVKRGYLAPIPEGESQVQALRRFVRAFRTILEHPATQPLVVAHALAIAWLREGMRARSVGAADLGINFKEPGVELAMPETFSREEVSGAVHALTAWLARTDG